METIAEVRLLDRDQLAPGDQAYAQLRLRDTTLLLPGDRFIVRQFSPVITIGGGRVLHAHPEKQKRNDPALRLHLDVLASGDREKIIEALVRQTKGGALTAAQLVSLTGWRLTDVEQRRGTGDGGQAPPPSECPRCLRRPGALGRVARSTLAAVDAFHKKEPLLEGMPKQELRERLFARSKRSSSLSWPTW
jgi:selenocysteine-specific elongation factor